MNGCIRDRTDGALQREMAVDLARAVESDQSPQPMASVDDLFSQLSFQPSFKVALHWILERLVEIDCVEARTTGTLVSTIFATRCGNPISKTCVRQLCKSILRTRQLWIYWIARRPYPLVANGEQSGDRNLLGPPRRAAVAKLFFTTTI